MRDEQPRTVDFYFTYVPPDGSLAVHILEILYGRYTIFIFTRYVYSIFRCAVIHPKAVCGVHILEILYYVYLYLRDMHIAFFIFFCAVIYTRCLVYVCM